VFYSSLILEDDNWAACAGGSGRGGAGPRGWDEYPHERLEQDWHF